MRVAAVALWFSACQNGDQFVPRGYVMESFFPFDGVRTWEFTSTDSTATQRLEASMTGEEVVLDDGTRTTEVRYDLVCIDPEDTSCEDAWVRSLVWSTTRHSGVVIHELHAPDGDVVFDPPVQFTGGEMTVGDVVTTEGGFSSEFVAIEPCPVLWTDEWDQCAKIHLDAPEGLAATHLSGDWWAVPSFNVVALDLASESAQWQLSFATYEAE